MINYLKRLILLLSVLTLAILPITSTAADSDNRVISFGVVPQQSASKLAKQWIPLLRYIETKTGYKIRFKTAPNIPSFEQRCLQGEYDIAYMNPYHYTVFHQKPGYYAFAHARDKKIKGIIVVRRVSPITRIEELMNSKIAFPAPAAFAASVLPRAYFNKHNINISPFYVSSHDSVYRAVSKGLYISGGGVMRTFNNMPDDIRSDLRILWTTKGYTPHAIAAHPRLNKTLVRNILKVLNNLHKSNDGIKIINRLKIKGFQSAINSNWDDVRSLNIDSLNKLVLQK